ncbi:nuclear transport factor 2 family protein [Mycobacterium marinum]|uniref:nuclear transport factor 2 family protein n=1 Tax=Mycobacterium marinum TaxID=1781 RepID=UPI00233FBBB3|nr:nuclear transport factor 2 family protein [Mycobacterium marinum]MDC8981863.1 nuclear transport factor 2 family protein [Mycobacterium marinum]MDC8993307.1 nuclear transport factor 2 family protein [Mycobacterium marinum]MDC8998325.1 nuclear transport factor 2 family protein [Mycobacterium marinum]MDC9009350.1 nuclear transport factor 2 family protein [Mycobacterium marinum]WDZ15284.1 nuclear transport factor 2 family protein [Mycobacterium marinum]
MRPEPAAVARDFIAAFSAADFGAMRHLLAADLIAHITNADGGADVVNGREDYLRRIAAMDLDAAQFRVELTQPPQPVDTDRVLVMVEVRARKGGSDQLQDLHNYAAHLLRVVRGQIAELHMVDAKPAESARFWA